MSEGTLFHTAARKYFDWAGIDRLILSGFVREVLKNMSSASSRHAREVLKNMSSASSRHARIYFGYIYTVHCMFVRFETRCMRNYAKLTDFSYSVILCTCRCPPL